jgi:MATE family, multidrug efflux pump
MSRPGTEARRQLGKTVGLALPIMAAQVGQMLMGVADTVMVGHIGVVPLSAVAFSNSILSTLFVFGIGILSSIGVLAAQAHGAGFSATKRLVLQTCVWVSALIGFGFALLLVAAQPALHLFNQPVEVLEAARPYLLIVGWSLVPALVFIGTKTYSEALSKPVGPMVFLYIGVVLNVFLNWVLIFGKLGAPAMGLEGAAWATLISRIAAMIGTASYCLHISGASLAAISPLPIPWGTVRSLFLIGAPVGLQYFSEVAAFNFGAIMIGWLGTSALAAHQIAITCAATTFMFPLGISQAVSVRIGQAVGAGAHHLVRLIGYGGLMLSAAVMALFALLFGLFGREIALAFNSDPGWSASLSGC